MERTCLAKNKNTDEQILFDPEVLWLSGEDVDNRDKESLSDN